MSTAPRLATWLLVRFSSGPHGEAIAGDLIEQYAARPSRLWYWRQVLSAIVADVVSTAGANRGRALALFALGWVAYAAASIPANWLIRASRPIAYQWMSAAGLDRLDAPGSALWMSLLQRTLIVTIVCIAIGWTVSRMDRRSGPAAVCALAVTVLIVEYSMMAILFSSTPMPQSISAIELIAPAAFTLSRPLGVLCGGVLGARASESAIARR
jgi:hypothetical protein